MPLDPAELWESCRFASARFQAVPPSSSREKPHPVKRPDGRNRPLLFSTKIGTLSSNEWLQYFPDEPYRPTFPNLPTPPDVTANDGLRSR